MGVDTHDSAQINAMDGKTGLHVFLVTIGSSGDVHPFVGMGLALRQRGHRVTLVTSDYFAPLASQAGLELLDPAPQLGFRELLDHPHIWRPIRGFIQILRERMGPLVEPVYRTIAERYVQGETIVVASSLALGARIAQDKLGVPTATVHLQPGVFRSLVEGPTLPGMWLGRRVPRPLKRLQYWMVDRVAADPLLSPFVNRLRRELGLPRVDRLTDVWWHSPQCVLGMFPAWYAAPQPDWPRQTVLTGFPLYDEADVCPPSEDARRFVESGSSPLVFTPGSANVQGRSFFESAIEACRLLGSKGLLLTRFPEQIPTDLPPEVRHEPYVPFSWLLSRAGAIVHHGGIGSLSQGFAAGCPQVITPLAFDQFDNAARLERLGVGRALDKRHRDGRSLAGALDMLLSSSAVREACASIKQRCVPGAGLARACDAIEGLAR